MLRAEGSEQLRVCSNPSAQTEGAQRRNDGGGLVRSDLKVSMERITRQKIQYLILPLSSQLTAGELGTSLGTGNFPRRLETSQN